MAGTTNPFFDAAIELGQDILKWKEDAAKATPVPFGQEKLTAEQMRQRLTTDQSFRAATLQEPGGREKILGLMKKGRASRATGAGFAPKVASFQAPTLGGE